MVYTLSKSTFIRGLQCAKSLYLYKNFYKQRDPVTTEQQAIFSRGINVGILAQQLFPGGIDVSPASPREYATAVNRTAELIKNGQTIIYEASFIADRTLVMLDILVKVNGEWHGYEVKSSLKISPTYLQDAALQYYVIKQAGVDLKSINIVNLNSEYKLNGKLNLHELFKATDVTTDCLKLQEFVKDTISQLCETLQLNHIPRIGIGMQCNSPYPCDFKGTCWKEVATDSILYSSGISAAKLFEWYNSGKTSFSQLEESEDLPAVSNRIIATLRNNSEYIDRELVKEFLSRMVFPVTFLDIEATMPAIPQYQQTGPYQIMPFLYSAYILNSPNDTPVNSYHLATEGQDPRKEILEALKRQLPPTGSIVVYDSSSEKQFLKQLIQKDDDKPYIDSLLNRIVDLAVPMEKRWYIHPATRGSIALKSLINVLFPDIVPQNKHISNGTLAMVYYENLTKENDLFKLAEIKDELVSYCNMDAYSLYKLYMHLNTLL